VTQTPPKDEETVSRNRLRKADETFDVVGAAISTAAGGALIGAAIAGFPGALTGAAVGAVTGGFFLRPGSNHRGQERNGHQTGQ
jgi:uncharacterized protein YcfJ